VQFGAIEESSGPAHMTCPDPGKKYFPKLYQLTCKKVLTPPVLSAPFI
jgi:hypothetical protein